MNKRFAVGVAIAATAMLLLGACGDDDASSTTTSESSTTTTVAGEDGSVTLAKGDDIELVGEDGLAGQTLNIDAEEENGEVTGEFRVTDVTVTIQCADTNTDAVIVLGGEVTDDPGGDVAVGDLLALIIREGDPDSVALLANDADAASCAELLESISDETLAEFGSFVNVENGNDIETG
jgi:hypothetical protein